MKMHKLLQHQILSYLPRSISRKGNSTSLLLPVNNLFHTSEGSGKITKGELAIGEQEYIEMNKDLRHEIALHKRYIEALKQTICTITNGDKIREPDDLLMATHYLSDDIKRGFADSLKRSQQLQKAALEDTADGLWQYHFSSEKMFFSKQYKKMLGYKEQEFKNTLKEWIKHIHPDDRNGAVKILEDYTGKKITSHKQVYRIQHKDGHYLRVLDRGLVLKSPYECNRIIIGTHTDITERKT